MKKKTSWQEKLADSRDMPRANQGQHIYGEIAREWSGRRRRAGVA